jgi:hypothetical protein
MIVGNKYWARAPGTYPASGHSPRTWAPSWPVVVICKWCRKGPRNVMVESTDGYRWVRPFRGMRKREG